MVDLLRLTADLVAKPSESFHEAPFVDWLEGELRELKHLETVRIGDNLVARTDLGRSQRLILAGHTETVPAIGNAIPSIDGDEVAQEHNGLNELMAERPDLPKGDCAILGEPTAGAIEAGCQGAIRFEVTVAGARAHTARPWMGRNAIHRLVPILTSLAEYEARTPTIDGCIYREAIQAVSVEGGVAGNVVPDRCVLRIHHRYAPDRSAVEAEQAIRDLLAPHLDDGDEVQVIDSSPACSQSLDHPILKQLVDRNNLQVRSKLGWTDVARFDQLGIPATNFGPGDPTVAHTADEYLDRRSIETVYKALVDLFGVGDEMPNDQISVASPESTTRT